MGIRRIKSLLLILGFCLPVWAGSAEAGGRISRTSQRTLRASANPAISVVPGFTAAAVSTSAVQWSWSTGSFTGSGLTGYKLYTSSAAGAYIPLALDTSYYIDAGLGADSSVTRWVTVYDATDQGSDSLHLQKYTYALPPAAIAISTDAPVAAPTTNSLSLPWARRYGTIMSTSAYAEIPQSYWYPNPVYASAYAVECSTNGGATYERNRTFFVPWETFPVLSNRQYMIRLAAVNGDDEVTPGVYSATRTFTTPPLTPAGFAAVALSSYTVEWRWDLNMYAGTGITGFNVYRSTLVADGELPTAGDPGEIVKSLAAGASYWQEVYIDSGTAAVANSRHTRWLRAVGYLKSERSGYYRKYTYAIAPGSATVLWIDPDPYWTAHVAEESLTLNWPTPDVSTATFGDIWREGIASQFVIDYSTTAGFSVAVSTALVGQPPQGISGLTSNTRYDIRVGAVNGDGEQTPADGRNPFAYSLLYRVITRPAPPSKYTCKPWTDTAISCTWSTATYKNPEYISGYTLGDLHYRADGTIYWSPVDFFAGVTSTGYSLDYLMTNSTHTVTIWAGQQDPDWKAGNPHYDASPQETEYHYKSYGSYGTNSDAYTYATPPNDVAFASVTAHAVGVWWKEPQVPATKYRVERSTTSGESGPWFFVSSVTGNSYLDTGLDVSASGLLPLTTYSYRIGAVNTLGYQTLGLSTATNGHRRDYSFVESTMTVQIAPVLYAAAAGTSAVNWSWTNSAPGVLSFNIYTSTDGMLMPGLSASATYWAEVGLSSANAGYTRRIRSVTSQGTSDFSEATAVTYALAPDSLAASATDLHTITLGWNGNGGTRYRLDRSADGAAWTTLKSWNDALAVSTYTDTGLHAAATYYYAVFAYNSAGALSASSSTTAGIRTLDLPAYLTQVYSTATAAQTVSAAMPGLGTLSVTLQAGAIRADDYVSLSTSAAAAPVEVSSAGIAAATAKLTQGSLLNGGVVELRRWDMYGAPDTADFAVPARVKFAYLDANDDGVVDGTSVSVNTLSILLLDTATLEWVLQRNSVLDRASKSVYLDTSHFSIYALASVTSYAGPLDKAFAYPSPYKPGSAGLFGQPALGDGIVFESLPAASTVKIYDLAGGLVRELADDDADGRCFWDTRNKAGSRAASGVYLYLVKSPGGGKKSGKVVIIR